MIFYFSGTGNSLYAAKVIAEAQREQLVSIADEMDKKNNVFEYTLKEKELLGFVYPVYAWAPPKMVLNFIKQMKVSGGKPYVFSVCTCGDEEGKTTKVLGKVLSKKDMVLDSAYSMQMPNNYIVGFDVDSKGVEKEKLQKAEEKLENINVALTKRQSDVFDIIEGKMATLKTVVVNPLFNWFGMDTKKFYATDVCTGCGLCEKVCLVHTIKVKEKPVWGKDCTQCLACINRCPVHAIQYGKGTIHKGRYIHPDLR